MARLGLSPDPSIPLPLRVSLLDGIERAVDGVVTPEEEAGQPPTQSVYNSGVKKLRVTLTKVIYLRVQNLNRSELCL